MEEKCCAAVKDTPIDGQKRDGPTEVVVHQAEKERETGIGVEKGKETEIGKEMQKEIKIEAALERETGFVI